MLPYLDARGCLRHTHAFFPPPFAFFSGKGQRRVVTIYVDKDRIRKNVLIVVYRLETLLHDFQMSIEEKDFCCKRSFYTYILKPALHQRLLNKVYSIMHKTGPTEGGEEKARVQASSAFAWYFFLSKEEEKSNILSRWMLVVRHTHLRWKKRVIFFEGKHGYFKTICCWFGRRRPGRQQVSFHFTRVLIGFFWDHKNSSLRISYQTFPRRLNFTVIGMISKRKIIIIVHCSTM